MVRFSMGHLDFLSIKPSGCTRPWRRLTL